MLVNCCDCRHEVSTTATVCPRCGRKLVFLGGEYITKTIYFRRKKYRYQDVRDYLSSLNNYFIGRFETWNLQFKFEQLWTADKNGTGETETDICRLMMNIYKDAASNNKIDRDIEEMFSAEAVSIAAQISQLKEKNLNWKYILEQHMCETCKGKGQKEEKEFSKIICAVCNGTGRKMVRQNCWCCKGTGIQKRWKSFFGYKYRGDGPCIGCSGKGYEDKQENCLECHGKGTRYEEKIKTITCNSCRGLGFKFNTYRQSYCTALYNKDREQQYINEEVEKCLKNKSL